LDNQHLARILIVEDEPMIALTLQDVLVDAGFEVTGVAGKLEKALALIESAGCDAAIVDANLAGVSASPAALALAARNLPFILLSGYSPEQLRDSFPATLFMKKPCHPAELIQALKTIVCASNKTPLL
jgi:DNA-binding response OmpR family regulator